MPKSIDIALIRPNPYNSRRTLDPTAVDRLANEIRVTGFWDAAVRVRANDGYFELIAGHIRLAALRKLGRKEINIDVVDIDDLGMAQ